MDIREKLVEILNEVQDCGQAETYSFGIVTVSRTDNYGVADHLVANNVTVQEWIPVTERFPEAVDEVLVLDENGNIFNSLFDDCQDEHKFGSWSGYYDPHTLGFVDGVWVPWEGITHWMPLPTLPKGEL